MRGKDPRFNKFNSRLDNFKNFSEALTTPLDERPYINNNVPYPRWM